MDTKYVFINDRYIEAAQASLFITDLAIQRGYGIFDFCKTIGNKPVFLANHLERFFHSASKMHLDPGYNATELEDILITLIHKNDMGDSGIKITLTGGYSPDGYMIGKPNLVITQQPLELKLSMDQKGISLVTYPHQRQLPEIKTLDYLMAIWLQPFIKEHHADDVLYHHNGLVNECPRANFFIVTKDEEIITAKNNILKGVIRKNVLKLDHPEFMISQRDFTLADLRNAKEAFITSTTKHIMPVVSIDGNPISGGMPGVITEQLSNLLLHKIRQQA